MRIKDRGKWREGHFSSGQFQMDPDYISQIHNHVGRRLDREGQLNFHSKAVSVYSCTKRQSTARSVSQIAPTIHVLSREGESQSHIQSGQRLDLF